MSHLFIIIIGWNDSSHDGQFDGLPRDSTFSTWKPSGCKCSEKCKESSSSSSDDDDDDDDDYNSSTSYRDDGDDDCYKLWG